MTVPRFVRRFGRPRPADRERVLGMRLQVDERVVEYAPPRRKAWVTVGEPRLLVVSAYRMGFALDAEADRTRARFGIDFELPSRGIPRWLGRLLGNVYARWCTAQMLRACRQRFARPELPRRPTAMCARCDARTRRPDDQPGSGA